ncbi:hypothetical protein LSH36_664g01042 [Paralvinella palmiformis]|uniref:Apple domain-containing protein n=1 Tax=Paralvinella palmiformis TaxID=53620 RepID=A0AAD9J4G1_9ANNE|nr:hypothetical protein LSH36_664g01042 [Paralvinella palmiformis]
MKRRTGIALLTLVSSITVANSEETQWCKTKGDTLGEFTPLTRIRTRSRIQCVQTCNRYMSAPWPCYTTHYDAGDCTLYAQSTLPEGCVTDTGNHHMTKKLKVSMYSHDEEVAYIAFNASGTNHSDWFSREGIIDSSYQNITNQKYDPWTPEFYSLKGYYVPSYYQSRRFYAYWYNSWCMFDTGWMAVLDELKGGCYWEKNGIRPTMLYSQYQEPRRYDMMKLAEKFVISARF